MATRVVGIAGKAGSGKSVASKAFEEQGFTLVKMAGPLKAMLRAFYLECGVPEWIIDSKIEGDLKEEPCELLGGKTPRYAMQTLGTEWGRNIMHKDLWTNAWSHAVDGIVGPVVCDDVRFVNEVETIMEIDGDVLLVDRKQDWKDVGSHVSEWSLPDTAYDAVLDNNGTKAEFEHTCNLTAIAALKGTSHE